MVAREGEMEFADAGIERQFAVGLKPERCFSDGMIASPSALRDGDERVSLQGSGEPWRRGA